MLSRIIDYFKPIPLSLLSNDIMKIVIDLTGLSLYLVNKRYHKLTNDIPFLNHFNDSNILYMQHFND